MRTAFVAKQQGVALAVITGIVRFLCHAHQATVRVLTLSGRDTFAHNGTPGILAQMNHFCSRVCLLMVIGYCHTIEFCRRIVAGKDARRILKVMAEPVSTCVQDSLLSTPLQWPRFVTKL